MFPILLSRLLVHLKFCSQRDSKRFIKNSLILVNGNVQNESEIFVNENDEVFVNGKKIKVPEEFYFALNKPEGYVCSTVSDSHKIALELIPPEFLKNSAGSPLHYCGRLDLDSCGLLILSTNGTFSDFLTRPKNHVEKKYIVKLKNSVSKNEQNEYCKKFLSGIELPDFKKSNGFTTKPAKLEFLSENECKISVCEGKFRQIRRMFLELQNEVIFLKRIQYGKISLGNLAEGNFRKLTNADLLPNDFNFIL